MLRAHIGGFIHFLRTENNASENTVRAYRHDLDSLCTHLEELGASAPEAVTPEQLGACFARLVEGRYAPATRRRRVVSARMFFKFLVQEKVLDLDPARFLVTPKQGRRLPKVLTVEQVDRMLGPAGIPGKGGGTSQEPAPIPMEPRELRNLALIELLYATGARVSEAVGIRMDDLVRNGEGRIFEVRLFGKGSRERTVPLGLRACEVMDLYLRDARSKVRGAAMSGHVFPGSRGGAMRRETAWKIVQKRGNASGLATRTYPHLLRHSFATHLIEGEADIRSVQEMLGHASPVTTQIYTHVDRRRLLETHRNFHPRA